MLSIMTININKSLHYIRFDTYYIWYDLDDECDQMHHFKAAEFLGLNLIKGFDDLSSKYSKQYVIIAEVTSVDCLNFDRT